MKIVPTSQRDRFMKIVPTSQRGPLFKEMEGVIGAKGEELLKQLNEFNSLHAHIHNYYFFHIPWLWILSWTFVPQYGLDLKRNFVDFLLDLIHNNNENSPGKKKKMKLLKLRMNHFFFWKKKFSSSFLIFLQILSNNLEIITSALVALRLCGREAEGFEKAGDEKVNFIQWHFIFKNLWIQNLLHEDSEIIDKLESFIWRNCGTFSFSFR